MQEEIWHIAHDFTKLPAKDILKSVLADDRKNYERAELELSEDIRLLDDAIVLYIESLQAAYQFTDKWRGNNCNRATLAMLSSALNYILLARHGVLLGYYPEVQVLLRSCYERISRSYVFSCREKLATQFLSGKRIEQATVKKELSKLEEDPDKRNVMFERLRSYYGFLSEDAHPNLKSFESRYGTKDLGQRVGLEVTLGGIMSAELGRVVILRVLQTVLSALLILGVLIIDETGGWDKEYQRISKQCHEMLTNSRK